jgi:hypothetical protein
MFFQLILVIHSLWETHSGAEREFFDLTSKVSISEKCFRTFHGGRKLLLLLLSQRDPKSWLTFR